MSEDLAKLFAYATEEATRAIAYYAAKRAPKKLGARVLRLGAIFATTVAALIPVFSQIFEKAGKPIIAPAWSTVAAGIAVLFILLDKFWGFTGAWVRFMVTEQALGEALTAFRIDWESKKLAWGGTEPSQGQVREMIAESKAFFGTDSQNRAARNQHVGDGVPGGRHPARTSSQGRSQGRRNGEPLTFICLRGLCCGQLTTADLPGGGGRGLLCGRSGNPRHYVSRRSGH